MQSALDVYDKIKKMLYEVCDMDSLVLTTYQSKSVSIADKSLPQEVHSLSRVSQLTKQLRLNGQYYYHHTDQHALFGTYRICANARDKRQN